MIYLLSVLAVIALPGYYWYLRWSDAPGLLKRSVSIPLMSLLVFALAVLVYLDRMDRTFMVDDSPILVSMVLDLSLSMGAAPDPRSHGDVGTRMQRVQKVLLPILDALDASDAGVMISVTAFTAIPETVLGWDNNLPQVREVIEYVIAPGMLTEPGSDLGAALQGVVPQFENLPAEYLDKKVRKYLLVVSDGEQTLEKGDMAAALADLRAKNVNIIALHTGLTDIPEGIPVYDKSGTFQGFQDINGQIYTIPDNETMALIAGTDGAKGLYVRAESSNAVRQISDFIGVQISSSAASSPLYTASVLLLIVLSLGMLLWFV